MKKWQNTIKFLLMIMLSSVSMECFSQVPTDSIPDDPAAIRVYKVQDMHFGMFSHNGSGGTVSISTDGLRSATGSVTLLNGGAPATQAIFDIDAPYETNVMIVLGPYVNLVSPNGGTMRLDITGCDPGPILTTYAIQPATTAINISGRLTVGSSAASPPGNYTGTFDVTFIQE